MQGIQNCANRIDNNSSCSSSIHEETTNEIGVYVEGYFDLVWPGKHCDLESKGFQRSLRSDIASQPFAI